MIYMQTFHYSKIKRVLQSALQTRYYRNLFHENNIDIANIMDYESFRKIPLTTKEIYRENKYDFIIDSIRNKLDVDLLQKNENNFQIYDAILNECGLNMVITSGSTGVPLEVIHSNSDDHRNYYALNRYRLKNSNVNLTGKYIWLLPMNEKTKQKFYSSECNFLKEKTGIQYFLTNYSDYNLSQLHKIIEAEKPTWMTGSPTAVAIYAKFLFDRNLSHSFQYIELHSEPCLEWQKEIIKRTFGDVFQCVYSSNEINFIAATQSCGHYHIIEDNVFVELIETQNRRSKKVIITALNSFDVPMIRYDIGDLAQEIECDKMETLSLKLTGYRDSDLIMRYDGTLCEPYIIYDSIYFLNKEYGLDIKIYQVKQISIDRFEYHIKEPAIKYDKIKYEVYLEEFLKFSLKTDITVEIKEFTLQTLLENKKYMRFSSMRQ